MVKKTWRILIAALLVSLTLGQGPSAASRSERSAVPVQHHWKLKVADFSCGVSLGDLTGDGTDELALLPLRDDADTVIVEGGDHGGRRDREWALDNGFLVRASTDGIVLPEAISAAGDVNGDGLGDIVVGAPDAGDLIGPATGAAYVIFGSAHPEDVDLADFDLGTQGDRGFKIRGLGPEAFTGAAVAGLDDLNGDGYGEIMVSSPGASRVHVVFGKTDSLPVDLGTTDWGLTEQSLTITTPRPREVAGISIDGAGDVNDDGVPDAVVGVFERLREPRGRHFIVFMDPAAESIDLLDRSSWDGITVRRSNGFRAAGLGDVNGDGHSDVLVTDGGSVVLVYGRSRGGVIRYNKLNGAGARFTTGDAEDGNGGSFAAAGDLDDDGLNDFILGTDGWDRGSKENAGAAHVIFGRRSYPSTTELPISRGWGQSFSATKANHYLGNCVAGGDFDGDGRSDVILGAGGAARGAGAVFVLDWHRE